jgi:hypothetical protein
MDHHVWQLGDPHQEKGPLVPREALDRLGVRLTIPEPANCAFGSLSEAFPLLVFVASLAALCAWELRACLRELVTELDVTELGDGLDRLAHRVGVEKAPIAQSLAKPFQSRSSLPSRSRAKDREDRRKVIDAFDREPLRAARAEAPEE